MSLQSIDISGFNSGVQKNNKKPFLFKDDAFAELYNAYVWREEVKKREGLKFIGRYRRSFAVRAIGNSVAVSWSFNIYTVYGIIPEATAEIAPGSVVVNIGAKVFSDQGNGLLTTPTNPTSNQGYINYLTGDIVIIHNSGVAASTASLAYYPTLPAMGIPLQEIVGINDEQTIWFDTKYAYTHDGSNFNEYLPVTPAITWNGTNSDFFWGTNYRGSTPEDRLFFVTNFVNNAGSPIRYSNNAVWTNFAPYVSRATPTNPAVDQKLYQARIIIPYYGRLLALNTWEGTESGGYAGAVNIYNRCRFSQIGSPIQADAWRSDIFGKGGFIDAPINEEIVSARFYKNTLIVFFERSTWRLQYIGEYGLPFIWERISSDYGSESTFSTILFDSGVLAVGDKAIVGSSGMDVKRIDADIPDTIYSFKNEENGHKRVHGLRDFKKEVVYWCYPDFETLQDGQFFPNKTLLYNYKNNTYAFFRNSVTCFGDFQYPSSITWDRLDVFWDDPTVLWETQVQTKAPVLVSGNHKGFAHYYSSPDSETSEDSTIDANDQESLNVTNVTVSSDVTLEIQNHNLLNDEIIYLTGLNYIVALDPDTGLPELGSTTLNNQIYMIEYVDINNFKLLMWNTEDNEFALNFDVTNVGTYVGGGVVALFPRMEIITKDFNPVKQVGQNIKTSHIDFLFDVSSPSPISVLMRMNTSSQVIGNLNIGNKSIETANSKTGYITGLTSDNPPICVITSKDHGLLTGDEITPQLVGGSVELNGNIYVITFLSTDTFSISEASISAYTSGGYWEQSKQQYFTLSGEYAWHRFFATCFGQFLSLHLTYSDEQMSQLATHKQDFVLNAIKIWFRPGGKNIFGK